MKCLICSKEFETVRELSNHLRFQEHTTAQEYYDLYLKKEGEGICSCGKPTKFDSLAKGYKKHCSLKCSNSDVLVQKKQQETTLKNFGVLHPAQNKDVVQKMHKVNLERYGVANGHGESQKEQIRQSNLAKYGVEHAFQASEIKEKSSQTKLERYGTEVYTNREKFQKTIKERYGATSISHLPDWQEKVDATKLRKYGSRTYNNAEKMVETKKIRATDTEQQKDCILVSTLKEKYGTGWTQSKLYSEIVFFDNGRAYVKTADIPKIQEYAEESGSHLETEIYKYIKSIYSGLVIRRIRKVIDPLELDLFIPDKKIAIEINGAWFHSANAGVAKFYHYNKSKLCADHGIRLIHIYEWEWLKYPEKIKQLLNICLGSVKKIYARNCEIKQISNAEAKPFNEATHIQGHRNAQVTYGLFYNNDLVQLMSFSKTRYNRNLGENDWEIIRGCPGSNNIVVGGVSKLFKHFIQDYAPSHVFSYCDFNKFDGKSYLALGMECVGYTGPNKWWLLNDGSVIERNPKRYKELKGNNKVWGSGSIKFVYTNKE